MPEFTEDQFNQLLETVRESAEPTEEEIEAAKEEEAENRREDRGGGDGAPKLNGNAGEEDGGDEKRQWFEQIDPDLPGIRSDSDRVPGWKRRTVRYLKALVDSASGNPERQQRAMQQMQQLRNHTENITLRQYKEENERAEAILEERDLNATQKRRVRSVSSSFDLAVARAKGLVDEDRGHSTLTDPEGGYLLPKPFLNELFVFIETYGFARNIYRTVQMESKQLDFKNVGSKPVAAWTEELGSINATEMEFGEGTMVAAKLAGISWFSNELEEDAAIAFLPTLTDLLGEDIAKKEDQAAFEGDGGSNYGGFTGLLRRGGVTTHTMGSGKTSFSDFDIDEAIEVVYNTISKSRRTGAQWLLPESTVKGLVKLKDGNGQYITIDPLNGRAITSLLGYPLVDPEGIHDELVPSDAADEVFGAFGNFNRALFGQRRGMETSTSTDAVLNDSDGNVTHNTFQQDSQLVKITERIAFGYPQEDAFAVIKTAAS